MHVILNSFGASIRRENGLFSISTADGKQLLTPRDVSTISISKGARISSDAVLLAIEEEIDILFIDGVGRPKGRVWSVKYGSISDIRRQQVAFLYSGQAVPWVKEIVTEKINNQVAMLLALKSNCPADQERSFSNAIRKIEDYKNKVRQLEGEAVADIAPSLRGWEGAASKRYFQGINYCLPDTYQFPRRSQHPAQDWFNAMLNYGYGMLYGKIEGALIKAGIDPYVGIFHRDDYNVKKMPEVVMAFTSPSGDGVKIMLRLDSPCSDAAMFSSFYKIYALRFGQLHGLSEVIDYRTSDVTRACFFSYDSEACFNPSAKRIAMADYLRDMNFDAAEKDIKEAEKLIAEQQMVSPPKEKTELDSDILQKIKSKLNPNSSLQKRKQYTHSPEVEQAIPMLKEALLDYNIELVETHKINYGKKLKVHANKLWAELNVFYGKKGFTIVPTTKTGSHEELAKLAAQATKEILASYNTKNQ